ncbi:unnamed protein product [Durusdinium trenchii]|uniref:Anoctamin n=1 Tax=Durusdinium trenchii TaxID=1381693 RepID=A0ABP0PKK4_9DINO
MWSRAARLLPVASVPVAIALHRKAPDFPPDSSGTGSVAGDAREPPSPVGLSAVAYAAVSETLLDRSMEAIQSVDFVDLEILRGTTLRASLRGLGRLWRYNPINLSPEERQALYLKSKPVKRLNVFLSHTWWTNGSWKVLSLLFHCGWLHALLCWLFVVAVTLLLCLLGALPMRLSFETLGTNCVLTCPMGFWILLLGFLGPVLGLFSAIYWPDCSTKPDTCFIDVASIHQTDKAQMKRGILGIGGFLLVSDELRILWSPPYLSRAWCVFELAVYRKGNPHGRVNLSPLFVEQYVAFTFLGEYFTAVGYWALRSMRGQVKQMLRSASRSFLSKHQLLKQFEQFDLDTVDCYDNDDRRFIHAAIIKWYGSKAAFNEYVRGPLRAELMGPILSNHLPLSYLMILIVPYLNMSLEFLVAMIRGGSSFECLLPFALAVLFSANFIFLPACVELLFLLCDKFAAPCFSSNILDCMQTLLIHLLFMVFAVGGARWRYCGIQERFVGSGFVLLHFPPAAAWSPQSQAQSTQDQGT